MVVEDQVYNTHAHLPVQNLFVLLAYLDILELLVQPAQTVVLATVMMEYQVVVDVLVFQALLDQIVNTQML